MPLAELTNRVVGGRLKDARRAAGLTQKQVADYMGVAGPQISYWEQGERQIDISSLSKMADLFGYSLSWFLGDDAQNSTISVSYRTDALSEADLKTVAWATRFVKNLELLQHLLENRHE
jgi:transcriptional regulator with XRE-family HTH domain